MYFNVKIKMGNAAFKESPKSEIQRCLKVVSDKLDQKFSGKILDINGNTIGSYRVKK